jgi:hypothetical protein
MSPVSGQANEARGGGAGARGSVPISPTLSDELTMRKSEGTQLLE